MHTTLGVLEEVCLAMKNKLIVIEGCDCSGKTTLVKDLKADIKAMNKGIKVLTISLPCRTRFGYTKIRDVLSGKSAFPPDVVQSLFLANMIETFDRDVNPFLLDDGPEDHLVILDRSIISTILYNAMQSGTIFDSIQTYLHRLSTLGVREIPPDANVVDLDIINKVYGHLAVSVDFTFFLMPPMHVVLKRAETKANQTGEANDTKASVQRMYHAYEAFYAFISGNMYRSVVDFLESPKGILRPQTRGLDTYIKLSDWNQQISEEDNSKSYREAILAKLEL